MAKRKRLSVPDPAAVSSGVASAAIPGTTPAPETKALFPMGVARHGAPIARVAGDAAASAALDDLAREMEAARAAGLMIQALPLDAVDAGYLVRDRMLAGEEEMAALIESLRARGQQTPIEVVALGGGRYGLISGWRRLTALRRLHDEAPEDPRFATILSVLRRPEASSDAYLAMVEENEIRVGLSYYERARIAARAAELGVFPDTASALARLFASASRAKRSKIGSFLRLYTALDDRLRFPAAIPERLGLRLARALDADAGLAERLRERLRKSPAETADAELAALERALAAGSKRPVAARPDPAPPAPPEPDPTPGAAGEQIAPGIHLSATPGRVVLEGPGVDALLQARLISWVRGS